MNRPVPGGDCRRRSRNPGRPSRFAGPVSRSGGLVGGAAADRRPATAGALNVIQHGGFERRRTNLALQERTRRSKRCALFSVRREESVGP
jgi:hypothetical protein